jgi:hypothetical protein
MAVGGAEAPGAGSANVVVADNTPPANVAFGNPSPASPTGQGRAASSGGPLPPVSTQPVQGKTNAPLRLAALDEALARVVGELEAAKTVEKVNKAEEKLRAAMALVCAAIRAEVESHARRSSFSPGQYDPSDLGQVEERIAFAYAELGEGSYVRDAIRRNQGERLPIEISNLSDAVEVQNYEISPAQSAEAKQIIRDAVKWVGEPRASDHSADEAQVKGKQFERPRRFLAQRGRRRPCGCPCPAKYQCPVRHARLPRSQNDAAVTKSAIGTSRTCVSTLQMPAFGG